MRFKKCGKFLARIVPVICVVCLVVSMAAPASAAEVFDYMDYSSTRTYADGSKRIITTLNYGSDPVIPSWAIFDVDNNYSYIDGVTSSYWDYEFDRNKLYQVKFYVAGSGNVWDISTIPDGMSFSLKVDVDIFSAVPDDSLDFTQTQYGFQILYYDKNLSYVSEQNVVLGNGDFGSFQAFTDLDIPSNARYARFDCVWYECKYVGSGSSLSVGMSAVSSELVFFVPPQSVSDDILNEQNKTNDLLDDIINGSAEDNASADQVEDKTDDALGDLESAGDALENVERPEIDADSLVPDQLFGDDYLLLVDTIKILWTSDIITDNITILAGFILLALVIHGKK